MLQGPQTWLHACCGLFQVTDKADDAPSTDECEKLLNLALRRNGWLKEFLGKGVCDVNNALEGSWPTLRDFIAGKPCPTRVLHAIRMLVIPYYVDKGKKPRKTPLENLSSDHTRLAYRLYMERKTKIITQDVAGKTTHFTLGRVSDIPDIDRKSTRLNSSHSQQSRMPSSA